MFTLAPNVQYGRKDQHIQHSGVSVSVHGHARRTYYLFITHFTSYCVPSMGLGTERRLCHGGPCSGALDGRTPQEDISCVLEGEACSRMTRAHGTSRGWSSY